MKKFLSLVLAMMMLCGVCAVSASAEDTIKVGMVTDVGGINDQSFNQFAWEGLKKLEEEDPSFKVQYLESKTDADYQTNINTFIDEEYDLIICVGYMLADATREAAEDNPEQYFAIVDDASIDLPNVACLTFAQEQCSYLVGLIAGYMTQTKTVGYIHGMVSETMNLFGVGYCAGVLEACPEAKILQYNANAFTDIAGGNTAAKDMITNGADVIYHAAGGTGLGMLNACEEEGIWGIGVDSDQAAVTGLNCVLSSALKETGTGAVDIAKSVKEGNFVGGVHHYTVADGAIGYATTGDHIPADVLEKVEAAKAAIISGELVVPTSVDEVPAFTLDD
ncbi:MAG: BMP family ABC transporter substrate-binding protein [Clostridia bacterium]|nr:BMP family ABC transporter substrate-binding protein [Clostridia bacterium]